MYDAKETSAGLQCLVKRSSLIMSRPSFSSLRNNYQTAIVSDYDNTCAIRMSMALIATDPTYKTNFRTSSTAKLTSGGYVRGAQDLAAILNRLWGTPDQSWAGKVGTPVRNGVICYMNIPSFSGQGHIGLWENGAPYDNDAYWNANPVWFWKLL